MRATPLIICWVELSQVGVFRDWESSGSKFYGQKISLYHKFRMVEYLRMAIKCARVATVVLHLSGCPTYGCPDLYYTKYPL